MNRHERQRRLEKAREPKPVNPIVPRTRAEADGPTTYRPGQAAEHFCPYVPFTPAWFIDLGPACAEEYLDARAAWPAVKLLGVEPSPVGYTAALTRWPADGILLNVAAWDKDEEITLHQAHDLLHGIAFKNDDYYRRDDPSGESSDMVRVPARTLDSLDREYGPFEDAVLWMDVDESELRVLRGATDLLARGAIGAVNIETRPETTKVIAKTMVRAGLVSVRQYFRCRTYWDEVWVRRDK